MLARRRTSAGLSSICSKIVEVKTRSVPICSTAPVEEALPGKDSIVGDEHVADKAVHEPSVRAQVGGQCFVQGLLGFDRLAMHRWIERGCPDHAVQAPEDVRSLLCGSTGHSRPPGRQVL